MTRVLISGLQLPDNSLSGDGRYCAIDLTASNVLAQNSIAGSRFRPTDCNLEGQRIRPFQDGIQIHEAMGRETDRDQWSALPWLMNAAIKRGRQGALERGCLIITGALADGALPVVAGRYRRALDSITFGVR